MIMEDLTNKTPLFSVVIPAFNEAQAIKRVIDELTKYLESIKQYEIIIVDDGSTDGTAEIIRILKSENEKIVIIPHKFRRGVGMAIKTGIKNAMGEWIFIFPGDGQGDPKDLERFLFLKDEADIILGYRKKRVDPYYRYFTSDLWKILIKFLFNINIRDLNWIKLIKKEVIKSIPIMSKSAFIDAEIIIRAKKMGFRIVEIPVAHRKRISGKTKCLAFLIVSDAISDIMKLRKTI